MKCAMCKAHVVPGKDATFTHGGVPGKVWHTACAEAAGLLVRAEPSFADWLRAQDGAAGAGDEAIIVEVERRVSVAMREARERCADQVERMGYPASNAIAAALRFAEGKGS